MAPGALRSGWEGVSASGEDEAVFLEGRTDFGFVSEVGDEPGPGAIELSVFDEVWMIGGEPVEDLVGWDRFMFHCSFQNAANMSTASR